MGIHSLAPSGSYGPRSSLRARSASERILFLDPLSFSIFDTSPKRKREVGVIRRASFFGRRVGSPIGRSIRGGNSLARAFGLVWASIFATSPKRKRADLVLGSASVLDLRYEPEVQARGWGHSSSKFFWASGWFADRSVDSRWEFTRLRFGLVWASIFATSPKRKRADLVLGSASVLDLRYKPEAQASGSCSWIRFHPRSSLQARSASERILFLDPLPSSIFATSPKCKRADLVLGSAFVLDLRYEPEAQASGSNFPRPHGSMILHLFPTRLSDPVPRLHKPLPPQALTPG